MEDYNELIEAYKEIYYANEGDFNVLNAIHLGENDHTNILCGILNLKVGDKKPFMKSFVEDILGIRDIVDYDSLMALTQISAIGSKEDSHGYIDLLIKDKDNKFLIVIENKVCDATDMPHQLDRYYFTFKDESNNTDLLDAYSDKEFINGCQTYWKDRANSKVASEGSNIYIVYLTKDGTKEPSEESINNKLKDELKNKGQYKGISYRDNISNWLNSIKTKSLTNNSIELYRLALNKFLTTKEDKNNAYLENEAIQSFIKEKVFKGENLSLVYQYINLKNTYDKLNDLKKKLDKDSESDLVLNDLVDCVECYHDNVFGQFAPKDWTIHCAPNWITFYPTRWMDKYGGNDNCNIHFGIKPWDSSKPSIDFAVQNDALDRYSNMIRTNKDFNNIVKGIAKNKNWPNNKCLSVKFDIIGLTWNIQEKESIRDFFDKFVMKCEEIQKIVQWIDKYLN